MSTYIPLDEEKEDHYEKLLDELKVNYSYRDIHVNRIIKNSFPEEENVLITNPSTVNIIVNKFTNFFSNSSLTSDVIQSSLEYNNYLIKNMIDNENQLNKLEFETCSNILWENLKKLTKNVDTHLKTNSLVNNKKYCEIYDNIVKSVHNKKHNSKRKRKVKDGNNSGLTILINKSILKEFN
jgi:hypothetical protein